MQVLLSKRILKLYMYFKMKSYKFNCQKNNNNKKGMIKNDSMN